MKPKATILIVDDEEEIREMLALHYRLEGYNAVTAEDVDAAEEALSRQRFDVVISDIMMPGGRLGTDLLTLIRDEYPMTHAIMITGHITMENALACMRRGADTCIFKPISDMAELDLAVERALEDIRRWKDKLTQLRGLNETGTNND